MITIAGLWAGYGGLDILRGVDLHVEAGATVLMVEQNVRFGLSLARHATVMSAGIVALAGPAGKIANHPDLMGLFFGAAKQRTPAAGESQRG